MTIVITKSASAISALIAGISAKSGAYKEHVSNSVLSAVAHSIEHGETSLIDELFATVFEVNPRDVAVVAKFIESVTPFTVAKETRQRREFCTVSGRLSKIEREAKETEKTFGERKVKALKQDNARCELFSAFAEGKGTPVRNTEFVSKEETPNTPRTVEVEYEGNIFAWFDDVEYLRKKESGAGANTVKPVSVVVMSFLNAMTKFQKADQFAAMGLTEEETAQFAAVMNMLSDKQQNALLAETEAVALKDMSDAQVQMWAELKAGYVAAGDTIDEIVKKAKTFRENQTKKSA